MCVSRSRQPELLIVKPSLLSPGLWNFVRLFAVVLTAAVLAACAEFSVVTNKTALRGVNRQTSLAAVSTMRYFLHSTHVRVTGTRAAEPYGLASFYSRDRKPRAAKSLMLTN